MKMKFHSEQYHDDHASVTLGEYPDGTTKLTIRNRYGSIMCDATVCLSDYAEEPAPGCVFIRSWGDNEGVLYALQQAGVIGRTLRTIETSHLTRDPLRQRLTHECRLLLGEEDEQ
jgi:hypothetical protein